MASHRILVYVLSKIGLILDVRSICIFSTFLKTVVVAKGKYYKIEHQEEIIRI